MAEPVPHKEVTHSYIYYPEQDQTEEESFSLAPMIHTIRAYRRTIKLSVSATAVVVLLSVLLACLLLPRYKYASLRFRLDFEGVDKGEYPNGLKFSPSEIVATPVLTEVFEKNRLQQYGTLEQFKESVYVAESNPELESLELQYRAKLVDTKLSPVDRDRIQKEYEKRRESVTKSHYSINLARTEYALSMPAGLSAKILNDVLEGWARNAEQKKGALKYQTPLYTRNVVTKDFLAAEDYIIATDVLRAKALRILGNINATASLPGANTIRVGAEKISLPEVRANLEDALRYRLEPLIGLLQRSGVSRNPRLAVGYFENRLAQVKLDQEEAAARVRTLQEALRQYTQERGAVTTGTGGSASSKSSEPGSMLIPQVSETFIDRLIEMSKETKDFEFRQIITNRIVAEGLNSVTLQKETAYYERSLNAVRGLAKLSGSGDLVPSIEASLQRALNDVLTAADQVTAIYQALSAQNLNPRTLLYTVTGPVTVRTERGFSLQTILLYGFVAFIFAVVAILAACLIHSRYFVNDRVVVNAPPT